MATPYSEANTKIDPTPYLSPEELQAWERLHLQKLKGPFTGDEELALARLSEKVKQRHELNVAQLDRLMGDV